MIEILFSFLKHLEKKSSGQKPIEVIQEICEPISCDFNEFWKKNDIAEDWLQGGFDQPKQTAILAKSLGKFPFWSGENNLSSFLETAYRQATKYVEKLLEAKPESF